MPTVRRYVAEFNLPTVWDKISDLNKKAARLGVPAIDAFVDREDRRPVYVENQFLENVIEYHEVAVEVTYEPIAIPGWTFLAVLDHGSEANVIRALGDHPAIRDYREAGNDCEHCGYNRDRLTTILVLNTETDEIKQVGSTCVKDFTGHNVESILAYASFVSEITSDEDDEFWGGSARRDPFLREVLTVAATVIRQVGWVSVGKAREYQTPTRDVVAGLLGPRGFADSGIDAPTQEDADLAMAAREWARAIDPKAASDYLYNLSAIARNDLVPHKQMGLAVSLISAYQRAVAKEAEKKARSEAASPVPVTDERITITGTVIKIDYKENPYTGDSRKVFTVVSDEGFSVWGTVPSAIRSVEVEDRVQFDAGVSPSDRDATFGFISRPTKAKVLAA